MAVIMRPKRGVLIAVFPLMNGPTRSRPTRVYAAIVSYGADARPHEPHA
jgi:hypothetical protein